MKKSDEATPTKDPLDGLEQELLKLLDARDPTAFEHMKRIFNQLVLAHQKSTLKYTQHHLSMLGVGGDGAFDVVAFAYIKAFDFIHHQFMNPEKESFRYTGLPFGQWMIRIVGSAKKTADGKWYNPGIIVPFAKGEKGVIYLEDMAKSQEGNDHDGEHEATDLVLYSKLGSPETPAEAINKLPDEKMRLARVAALLHKLPEEQHFSTLFQWKWDGALLEKLDVLSANAEELTAKNVSRQFDNFKEVVSEIAEKVGFSFKQQKRIRKNAEHIVSLAEHRKQHFTLRELVAELLDVNAATISDWNKKVKTFLAAKGLKNVQLGNDSSRLTQAAA